MMSSVLPSKLHTTTALRFAPNTFQCIYKFITFLVLFALLSMFFSSELHLYLGALLDWSPAIAEYGCPTMAL